MPAELWVTCSLCGEPVDALSPYTWQRVYGWERKTGRFKKRGGGGSDIRLRETREKYAHDSCISMAKRGVSPQQMEMGA